MIIAISGSVGSGKTSLSKLLSKKLNYEIVHLNDIAKNFKLEEIKDIQTFDFDLDKLLIFIEKKIKEYKKNKKNIILESHFSHFINPKLVDYLFIINRDLKDLKKEYINRKYNLQKQKDNLEVEAFNLCFYEGLDEEYEEEKQIFCLKNDSNLDDLVEEIVKKIKN